MGNFKVAIGAGHGGNNSTPGKRTPDGEYEWDFNNKVVKAAIKYLSQYEEIDILRMDDESGMTDVPLAKRTGKANEWGADILISFHHNAFQGKWGNHTGTSVYVLDDGAQPKSSKLADLVLDGIVSEYGLKNRGIKRANFHMLRETNNGMAAILPEGAFMDSVIDIKKMRDDSVLRKVGYAVGEAVALYFGLDVKPRPNEKKDYKGHWAESAIDWTIAEGYMKGRSSEVFDPEAPLTRAEFATVLQRIFSNK